MVTFLSVFFPVVFHSLLPLTLFSHSFLPIILPSSFPSPLEPGTVAGSQRLRQIINAADPLEIQADVHWTHVREKEEEERMAPASESCASGGNCCRTQGPNASGSFSVPASSLTAAENSSVRVKDTPPPPRDQT